MYYASGLVFINDTSLSTISLTNAYKIKSTSNTVNIDKNSILKVGYCMIMKLLRGNKEMLQCQINFIMRLHHFDDPVHFNYTVILNPIHHLEPH